MIDAAPPQKTVQEVVLEEIRKPKKAIVQTYQKEDLDTVTGRKKAVEDLGGKVKLGGNFQTGIDLTRGNFPKLQGKLNLELGDVGELGLFGDKGIISKNLYGEITGGVGRKLPFYPAFQVDVEQGEKSKLWVGVDSKYSTVCNRLKMKSRGFITRAGEKLKGFGQINLKYIFPGNFEANGMVRVFPEENNRFDTVVNAGIRHYLIRHGYVDLHAWKTKKNDYAVTGSVGIKF